MATAALISVPVNALTLQDVRLTSHLCLGCGHGWNSDGVWEGGYGC